MKYGTVVFVTKPTKVEAKPSDPALGFGADDEPFRNPVPTVVQRPCATCGRKQRFSIP
jgi:hypothetical protein